MICIGGLTLKEQSNQTDQLKNLLIEVYKKGDTGATLNDIMSLLKGELPKITNET